MDFDDLFLKTHVSHHMEVLDEAATSFRSEHVYVIKARGRCRFFCRRFRWTGGDTIQEPDVVCDYDQWGHPRHRMHGPVIKEGDWFIWLIDLGQTLEVGKEDIVHLRHSLHSLNGTFEPFLNFGIGNGGVEHVTLAVTLPPAFIGKVSYSESTRPSGQITHSEILEPKRIQQSGGKLYEKICDLNGTETNMNLRLDW
jgi:hypothetical protein